MPACTVQLPCLGLTHLKVIRAVVVVAKFGLKTRLAEYRHSFSKLLEGRGKLSKEV